MLGLIQMASRIAATDVTVLIQGESGTGKELIAKHIHQNSNRADKPIISINCGAIQENLLLSELFGHEKGAFTGAITQKVGLVEVVDGGTLFLDEIGEMGLEAQAKLLRFLQEGEIHRLGARAPIKVDVRVLSATNRDLESEMRKGKFREDLYYRINTLSLRISPLRKRPEDVPLVIEALLGDNPTRLRITRAAMEVLKRYHWPGNVRELQNAIERFKILVDSDLVTEDDIPFNIKSPGLDVDYFSGSSSFLLERIERKHILRVLEHFKGNKTRAANAMGITVKTLYNKLARYQKERHQYVNSGAEAEPLHH